MSPDQKTKAERLVAAIAAREVALRVVVDARVAYADADRRVREIQAEPIAAREVALRVAVDARVAYADADRRVREIQAEPEP